MKERTVQLMREDYVPNEKYRNMFGVERNGYGCERVDLYLAQLEVAFKKIREDNRGLKHALAEGGAAQSCGTPAPQPVSYAGAESEIVAQLQAQLAEQNDLRQRMQGQTENLMAQITALRGEADELRQRLRGGAQGYPAEPGALEGGDAQLIGRVLLEARATAEETVRAARLEADGILRKARQRTEELRAEQERAYAQLQDIAYALRNVLRDGPEDIKRGEEFAIS
ncbi:MAG: hypothetical protein LBC83_02740 [Oscillospiraceae bacterium]|nr:hypothetical protein [Oscillospiraceae bacterium]